MKITLKDLYDFNNETKFVENGYFKVNTPTGFKSIEAIDITAKNSKKLKIFTTNYNIIVSPEHLLYSMNWVKTNTLKIGDFIDTINGYEEIKNIIDDNKKEDLYDIQVLGNEFYANSIRSHNSTIKQAIEFSLFGKVQDKRGRRLSIDKLPNRRNDSLYVGIYFKNNNGDDIVMKRYVKPKNFEMSVNGEDYADKFKKLSEQEREKIVGYSFDVFKSFISLNINDFKNFISLSKDDKENLLNKLFNLEELDKLLSITKELDKANQKLLNEYEFKIDENDNIIDEYKSTINKINKNIESNKTNRLNELKKEIMSKKPIYELFNSNIEKFNTENTEIKTKLYDLSVIKSKNEKVLAKLEFEKEHIIEKIEIFNTGQCPICNSNLKDEQHIKELDKLESDLIELDNKISDSKKFLEKCILENTKLNNDKDDIYQKNKKNEIDLNIIKSELIILNKEYKNLKEENTEDISIEELHEKTNQLKQHNIKNKEIYDTLKEKSDVYDELIEILSFDGIRKTIISNIIKPINNYLNEFLNKLNSTYTAELNDNFDAKIFELGIIEIDPQTLSNGEDKKINLAIALSYLKVVLDLKHSNIMFLDEIFDGIDPENIELLLKVLRDISVEYNINIIIVSFGHINLDYFKKVIKVEKNIFSNLSVINL